MKAKFIALFLMILLFVSGCGLIDWIEDNVPPISPNPTPTVTPVPTVIPTPVPTVKPTLTATPKPTAAPTPPSTGNPIVTNPQYFEDGAGGNLWKPVSDTTGNLVLVFSSKFKVPFSGGCLVEKRDGKFEKLYCGGAFACYGNPDSGGDRLHMRSNIKCAEAKEVKVVCTDVKQVLTFTVKKSADLSKVCQRFD